MRNELDAILSLQRYFGMVLEPPWDVRRVVETSQEPPERPYALLTRNGPTLTSGPKDALLVTLAITLHAYPAPADTREASEDDELELRNLLWEAIEYGVEPGRHRRIPLWDYTGRDARQAIRLTASGGTFALEAVDDDFDPFVTGPIEWDAPAQTLVDELEALEPFAGGTVEVVLRGRGAWDVIFTGTLGKRPVELLTVDGDELVYNRGPAAATSKHLLVGAPPPVRSTHDFLRVSTDPAINTVREDDDPRMMMVALDLRCTFRRGQPVPSAEMILQRIRAGG